MGISKATLEQLLQPLYQYNPTTNTAMEKIAVVLQPIGIAILAILYLVELNSYAKKFDSEEGGLTANVHLHIAMKYLIGVFFIMTSSMIVDGIVWIGIQAAHWINSIVEMVGVSNEIPPLTKLPVWQRPLAFIFRIFAYIAMVLSGWVGSILIFLRGIELYIIKAIAPILVAFYVNDELRSITVGFFKYLMAVVLQGALLILILGLVPILTTNDYLSFQPLTGDVINKAGAAIVNVLDYVTLIGKYVVVIFLLIGSQRKAKQFMGAA